MHGTYISHDHVTKSRQYRTPHKRGKGSDAYTQRQAKKETPYTIHISKIEPISSFEENSQTTSDNMSPMKVLELYYTFICRGTYVIPKSKFEYFVMTTLSQPRSHDELTVEEQCLFVLYLAIRSLAEQLCEQVENADKTARMAELELAKMSVEFHTNFYYCCACMYVSLFHHAMGNTEKSNYYSYQAKYYWSLGKPNLDQYELQLKKIELFWKNLYGSTMLDFRAFVFSMPAIYEVAVDNTLEDHLPEGVWDYVKIAQITMSNYKIYMDIMQTVSISIQQYRTQTIAKMVDCNSDTFFQHEQLQATLVYEGVKFNFLNKLSDVAFVPILEEMAHDICLMTEHPLFPFCAPVVFIAILRISEHHLKCCQLVETGLKPRIFTITSSKTQQPLTIDYLEDLRRDHRALQLLSKRYRFISLQHGDLLMNVELFLSRYQQHQHQDVVGSNQTTVQQSVVNTEVMQNDEILMALLKYVQAVSKNMPLQ